MDAGPEDLVLSGASESAFEAEGLIFDKFSGSFSRERTMRGTVCLEAQGVEAYWAQRALNRMGFSSRRGASKGKPIVKFKEHGHWELIVDRERASFTNLSSLMKSLVYRNLLRMNDDAA